VAVAIDGQIYQETLLEPIGPDSEVFILHADRGRMPTQPLALLPGARAIERGARVRIELELDPAE